MALLEKLKEDPKIDTICIYNKNIKASLSKNLSSGLIKLLKSTIQITKVTYQNCAVSVDELLEIEEQLSLNIEYAESRTKTSQVALPFQHITLVGLLERYSNSLKLQQLNGSQKKIILNLEYYSIGLHEEISKLNEISEQFPQIIGLHLRLKLVKLEMPTLQKLKQLFCRLEFLSLEFLDEIIESKEDNIKILNLLSDNISIKTLKIFSITPATQHVLSNILIDNQFITSLELNFKGQQKLHDLCLGLNKNVGLRKLRLSGEDCLRDLINIECISYELESHPNIRCLHLDNGYVSEEAMVFVSELVKNNSSLESLYLSGDYISAFSFEFIM